MERQARQDGESYFSTRESELRILVDTKYHTKGALKNFNDSMGIQSKKAM